jgi:hypothetical protein
MPAKIAIIQVSYDAVLVVDHFCPSYLGFDKPASSNGGRGADGVAAAVDIVC